MYMLQLFDSADEVHPIDARLLREGVLKIGRDTSADWTIVDAERTISRTHCELAVDHDRLHLRCQGANGVFDEAGERLPDGVDVPLTLPFSFRLGAYRIAASRAPHARDALADGTMCVAADTLSTDAAAEPAPRRAGAGDGALLDAFCEGAGIDVSLLSTEEPTEIMRRAGAVYRQMVAGLAELMAERDRAREGYAMSRTTIAGVGNNPFKWGPAQRLAIDLLLAQSTSFLSGPAALKASFRDVKRHMAATLAGMRGALRAVADRFDPQAVDRAVTERGSLLKGRAALQMDKVAERHAELVRDLAEARGDSPVDRAFVQAYDAAEAAATRAR